MNHFFRIFRQLWILNSTSLFVYRANLVNNVVASFIWGLATIISILLVTNRVSSVFGWTRTELLIMAGMYSIVIGIFHMFYSRNFDRFAWLINRGELDSVLLKPFDAQLLVSHYLINPASSIRIVIGTVFIGYLLSTYHIAVKPEVVLVAVICIPFSIITLYSFWFIMVTVTIWFSRATNIVDLLYSTSSIARYPAELAKEFAYFVFLFLFPLTLIVTTPSKALLSKGNVWDILLLLLICIVLFIVSRLFWKFALRYYTSASG